MYSLRHPLIYYIAINAVVRAALQAEYKAPSIPTCSASYSSLMLEIQSHSITTPIISAVIASNKSTSPWISSVWCQNSSISGIQCKFENLCYDSIGQSFFFISGPTSVVHGISSVSLLNTELYLSSVKGHNAYITSIATVPFYSFDYDETLNENIAIFMARFKPDNIHHVFHDDLLPLYFTIRQICESNLQCTRKLHLFFLDNYNSNLYTELYQLFVDKMFQGGSLERNIECFKTSYIGLNKLSVWYQYGFGNYQTSLDYTIFNSYLLQEFSSFVRDKLDIIVDENSQECFGTLFSRKLTRKILNEEEVLDEISLLLSENFDSRDCFHRSVSLENHSIRHIIKVISSSKMLVGMHGSGLIFGLFLPENSLLVELWPYNVNPDSASVYKAMCGLHGSRIGYISWTNKDFENSVPHPEYPKYHGGLDEIDSLTSGELVKDLLAESLDIVECCDSPSWLLRIYQDSYITIATSAVSASTGLHDIVAPVLEGMVSMEPSSWSGRVEAGRPVEVHCVIADGEGVRVLWQQDGLGCRVYEVVVQADHFLPVSYIIRHSTVFSIALNKISGIDTVEQVHTWVSIVCEDRVGPATYAPCIWIHH